MAPLRDPKSRPTLNSILIALFSLFKPKQPTRRPNSSTSPEGIDSMELKDWGTPSFPTDTDTIEPSDPPAGFELKPAGPEKESWLVIPDLQNSDDYDELVSNTWNHKRSGIILLPCQGFQHC